MHLTQQKRQYYFRDYMETGERLQLQGKRLVCELVSRYAMNQEYEGLLQEGGPIALILPPGPGVAASERGNAQLELHYDNRLKADGYRLEIRKDAKIQIHASNKRGLQYGMNALQHLLERDGQQCTLPIVNIQDEPSFPVRGIIEGFYGVPWSFDDRMDAIAFMSDHRMNSFMYAPKDDPYHRELWRDPYPEDDFQRIAELKQQCDRYQVDFYYCISPGNDLAFDSEADFACLTRKLEAMISLGIRHFALLMDDIDYVLTGANRHFLERSGRAHAYITNRMNDWLGARLPVHTLAMCPSEYWSYWDTEYKRDMREQLQPEVKVFWTGYFVFAPEIGEEHARDNRDFYGHDLWLWDNIPVNDCDKDRLFLDPMRNRYSRLHDTGHTGMVANPMNQWECSKITLITMSHYMWNSERYMPDLSWSWAVEEFAGPAAEEMMFFCRQNLNSRLYFGGYEEVEQAVAAGDTVWLDGYFDRLQRSVTRLRQLENAKFQQEAGPWLERAEQEAGLWAALRDQLVDLNEDTEIKGSPNGSAAIGGSLTEQKLKLCLASPVQLGCNAALAAAVRLGFAERDEKGRYASREGALAAGGSPASSEALSVMESISGNHSADGRE
ncbi:beta-N-acetylglucosaminidase domain-containing protein [Paenibacillus sp. JX-17]|uniref:Beta-N-acetylglucosaminidase domain-containing protein n=1 Tax=Paenibacillus lacisoli TaxID=3064525 RepID=A0ABT9CE46_9BACL|nr:beta-N-acetylglucosaminidase domain-containing protein [Paenibacillus sp. JX-17]MDO7906848.1 beta-N-acetylglucosaminidase domain-containing protein [Paenibacillus sp. JX-17]